MTDRRLRTVVQRLRECAATLPLDARAASLATVLAALTAVVLFGLQTGVTTAVTGGTQPMVGVGDVPVQPQTATWEEAPNRTVELNEQQMAVPFGGGSVDELDVRALTNGSHVAFRLEWTDPTRDADAAAPGNYSDAGAVLFGTGEIPPITMGAVGEPVNIWYWRASWEENASAYGSGGMYSYPNEQAGLPSIPGRAADNPLSRAQYDRGAQNYYAEGFGSTSHGPSQPVRATGTRTDDGWAVTFVRERTADAEYDVTFSEDRDVYLAFAVWNGSADERNGQKSITLQYTALDPETGALSAANPGGSGGGSDGGDGAAGSESAPTDPELTGWIAVLLTSVVLVWSVSYWRLRE